MTAVIQRERGYWHSNNVWNYSMLPSWMLIWEGGALGYCALGGQDVCV